MTKKQQLEQYPRIERERDRLDAILNDVMNDRVTFGRWISDTDGSGKYRVGISRSNSYPIALVIWRCAGQNDSTNAYDLEPFEDDLRRLRSNSDCYQPILDAVASAKQAANLKGATA